MLSTVTIENALWAVVFIVAALGPLWLRDRGRSSGRSQLFDPKYIFMLYLSLMIGGTGLITILSQQSGLLGIDPLANSEVYRRVFLVSIAGVLCFHAGNILVSDRFRPRLDHLCDIFDRRRSAWTLGISAVVGYAVFGAFLQSQGGVATFLANRENFRSTLEGAGALTFPITVIAPYAAIAFAIARLGPSSTKADIWKSFMALVLVMPPVILFGFRILILPPVFFLAAVWHIRYRPIDIKRAIVGGALLAVILTGYGVQRQLQEVQQLGLQANLTTLGPKNISDQLLTRSMGAEITASIISQLDHTGDYANPFGSILEAATIPIPRQLWKDKPEGHSVDMATTFFGSALSYRDAYVRETYGGVSPTAIGEYYWYGGPLAVMVAMFILGCFAAWLVKMQAANPRSDVVLLLYLTGFWTVAYCAESPQQALNSLAMNGALAVILSLILATKTER